MAAIITTVEMGETSIQKTPGARLQAYGLGACVGLCLYETHTQVAVLVHVVLPQTLPLVSGRPAITALPGKCADTAVVHALAELMRSGGNLQMVRAALVGGAQIFTPQNAGSTETASLSRLEIGQRNVLALKEEMSRAGIPICAAETGGHGGRTVTLEVGTGDVWVRPVGLPERLLISLGRLSATPALPPLSTPVQSVREGVRYGN